MSNLIIRTPELQIIEKSKAEKIKQTFEPMVKMLENFEQSFNEVVTLSETEITNEVTTKAKRLRLDIAKVRIETGKLKDKQKEYMKLEDKAIMGVHNIIVWAVREKEDKLKEIEKHFEILEQKRIEKLQNDRAEKLSKYVVDAYDRDLAKFTNEEWTLYFSAKKKMYKDEQEALRQAKLEMIAKEKAKKEEQERLRKENEKLRKEAKIAEAKKIKAEKERQKLAKIEAEILEKKRKEQERIILETRAKVKAELEKKEAEKQKLIAIEKAKVEKLQAELEAKKQAEIKIEQAKIATIEANAKKGDVSKVNDLIADLNIISQKYKFKSRKNQKMYTEVKTHIDNIINLIQNTSLN